MSAARLRERGYLEAEIDALIDGLAKLRDAPKGAGVKVEQTSHGFERALEKQTR
jgi:hypothetical protein